VGFSKLNADVLGAGFNDGLMGGGAIAASPLKSCCKRVIVIEIKATENTAIRTSQYGTLTDELVGSGFQANHLNQNAAFKSIIPEEEGLAVGMRGNAFSEVGSPHYNFHMSMEEFWTPYRKGGNLFGQLPTNEQYGVALQQALIRSGYTPEQAAILAQQAADQRAAFQLVPSAHVPRIPGRLPQKRP